MSSYSSKDVGDAIFAFCEHFDGQVYSYQFEIVGRVLYGWLASQTRRCRREENMAVTSRVPLGTYIPIPR